MKLRGDQRKEKRKRRKIGKGNIKTRKEWRDVQKRARKSRSSDTIFRSDLFNYSTSSSRSIASFFDSIPPLHENPFH